VLGLLPLLSLLLHAAASAPSSAAPQTPLIRFHRVIRPSWFNRRAGLLGVQNEDGISGRDYSRRLGSLATGGVRDSVSRSIRIRSLSGATRAGSRWSALARLRWSTSSDW